MYYLLILKLALYFIILFIKFMLPFNTLIIKILFWRVIFGVFLEGPKRSFLGYIFGVYFNSYLLVLYCCSYFYSILLFISIDT